MREKTAGAISHPILTVRKRPVAPLAGEWLVGLLPTTFIDRIINESGGPIGKQDYSGNSCDERSRVRLESPGSQQANKNADNGNDDQQLDEREAAPAATHWR
jgi:hypothetical protein